MKLPRRSQIVIRNYFLLCLGKGLRLIQLKCWNNKGTSKKSTSPRPKQKYPIKIPTVCILRYIYLSSKEATKRISFSTYCIIFYFSCSLRKLINKRTNSLYWHSRFVQLFSFFLNLLCTRRSFQLQLVKLLQHFSHVFSGNDVDISAECPVGSTILLGTKNV